MSFPAKMWTGRVTFKFLKYLLVAFMCINVLTILLMSKNTGEKCVPAKYEDIISYMRTFKQFNPLNITTLISPSKVCRDPIAPSLVIIIASVGSHFDIRKTIRETWASFRNVGNASLDDGATIELIFVVAKVNISKAYMYTLHKESEIYGDILLIDIPEIYHYITHKILIGMKWMANSCRKAKYMLKVDEDVYVNIPELIRRLSFYDGNSIMIGYTYENSYVQRSGQHQIYFKDYKFCKYLPYLEGNSYVISGRAVPTLVNVSNYIPIVPMDDVYITGILRAVLDIPIKNISGFASYLTSINHDGNLDPFYSQHTVSETKCTQLTMHKLWTLYLKTNF